jgi:hypothetical protein
MKVLYFEVCLRSDTFLFGIGTETIFFVSFQTCILTDSTCYQKDNLIYTHPYYSHTIHICGTNIICIWLLH